MSENEPVTLQIEGASSSPPDSPFRHFLHYTEAMTKLERARLDAMSTGDHSRILPFKTYDHALISLYGNMQFTDSHTPDIIEWCEPFSFMAKFVGITLCGTGAFYGVGMGMNYAWRKYRSRQLKMHYKNIKPIILWKPICIVAGTLVGLRTSIRFLTYELINLSGPASWEMRRLIHNCLIYPEAIPPLAPEEMESRWPYLTDQQSSPPPEIVYKVIEDLEFKRDEREQQIKEATAS